MRWNLRMRRHRRDSLAAAEAEVARSEQRRDAIREHVIRPLRETATRNQFADMIRATLEGGKH